MGVDIFEYWSVVGPKKKIHPADRFVLNTAMHPFELECLPNCFSGPLKSAPVVMLYLSPGFRPEDVDRAKEKIEQERAYETRKGVSELSNSPWYRRRTEDFGDWDSVKRKVAVLNISPYKSKSFTNRELLVSLPSCRVSIHWAQTVLFPQAISGNRIVICMRSAKYWGLNNDRNYEGSLFVPKVTRNGFMEKGRERDSLTAKIRDIVGNG